VARVGFDKAKTVGREQVPFEIRFENGRGLEAVRADAVIDASGTWSTPNPAGVSGLEAIGEAANAKRIAYGMSDVLGSQRARYANKVVAVLGAGHSAVGTVLDLAQLKKEAPATEIIWVLRGDKPDKSFGGGINDKLAARGELGKVFARLRTSATTSESVCGLAPCGDVTQGVGIPWMLPGAYARWHDRLPGDSRPLGDGGVEAR
jgi:hypothetical protein